MNEQKADALGEPLNLLAGWISRAQLAAELGFKVDTLARWEARREGPPCSRIGRKVFYRRTAVESWLASLDAPQSRRATSTQLRRVGGRR